MEFNHHLPYWAKALVKLLVHTDFREEIEGDLYEKYDADCIKYNIKKARKLLLIECLSLFKLNIFFNLNHLAIMHSRNWLGLLSITLLMVIGSISPFIPGSHNEFAHGLSRFAQTLGFIGLVFIPFGLFWLIIEWRNKKDQKLNRWTNGYYPAWLTMTPIFIFIPSQIALSIYLNDSLDFELWPIIIVLSFLGFCIYRIQKLKNKTDYKFNPMPVYILVLPIIALLTTQLAVKKAAAYTRESVIIKTEPLIQALEKYKNENQVYPERLEDLVGNYIMDIPSFKAMGLKAYQYEKNNTSYQLSFEQYYHWFATELVAYMKNGHDVTKANYENYPTSHQDWRYFMVD